MVTIYTTCCEIKNLRILQPTIFTCFIYVFLDLPRVLEFSFGVPSFVQSSPTLDNPRKCECLKIMHSKSLESGNCVTRMMNHPVSAAQRTVSDRTVPHQHGPYVKPRHQQGAGVINECQHQFHATANKTNIHHYGKPAPMQHDGHAV